MSEVVKKVAIPGASTDGGMSPIGLLEAKARAAKGNLNQSMYPSSREMPTPKPAGAVSTDGKAG